MPSNMPDALRKNLSATKVISKDKPITSAAVHKPLRDKSASTDRDTATRRPRSRDEQQTRADKRSPSPKPSSPDPPSQQHAQSPQVDPREYDVQHPTGEKRRDTMRTRLAEALRKDVHGVEKGEAAQVANAIEHAIDNKFGSNKVQSRQKYQNLLFNLKDEKNTRLREAVLGKMIAPSELVEMGSDALANDELRERRKVVQERMTRDAMPFNKQAATTNMFKCGKCKGRNTTYYQMQTRSADEPLTTFVQCTDCTNRWRF